MKHELDSTLGSTIPEASASGDRPRLETFDRVDDRFELGAEIGRGGMGRVVAATDVALARPVAIKQILSDRPDDLARFEREVRITAQLEHPSIVPIHEAARDGQGRPYYVMRRIEGDPLTARLDGADLRTRLALLPNLLAVVDAAAFAHARNIIHRDIKPSNILLGAYGETHLIDWGLARRLDDLDVSSPRAAQADTLTQVGHVYGTVGYMAPEQARGEPVDARADVYALGATLFHVLAGHAPFAHLTQAERLAAAVTGDDRPQLDKLADAPPELIAIVDKAMTSDRDQRYEHAGELAADLRAFLGGKLVAAHRYTTAERLGRFIRKHRFAVALSVISLITVAVISAVAVSRIIEERDVAEAAQHTAELEESNAQARADLLLIERASALAPSDPTRAAALLLGLRDATPHTQRARDAISKIAAFGIARGNAKHTGPVNGLAFSPDGTRLASTGEDGLVVLYDVGTGRADPLVDLHTPLYQVMWVDRHTLFVTGRKLLGGRLVDVRTATARPFGDDVELHRWWRVGDRLRYLDDVRHTLFEVPFAGGTKRAIAVDVKDAIGAGEIALVTTSSAVLLLDHETLTPLPDVPANPASFAIRPDGKRVAVASFTECVEWDVATIQRTRRWPTGQTLWLVYDKQVLVAVTSESQLQLLYGDGITRPYPVKVAPLWSTQLASGLVLGFENGMLMVFDDGGVHVLENQHVGARTLASLPDSMTVAMGSRDGTVRWLDLSSVTPRPTQLDSMITVCGATDRFIYGSTADGLLEVEIATGRRRLIRAPHAYLNFGVECTHVMGDHLIAFSPAGISIVNLTAGVVHHIADATYPAVEFGRAAFAVGPDVFELPPGSDTPVKVFTAPAAVDMVGILEHWVVLALADHRILRLDRSTNTTAMFPAETQIFGVMSDGHVFYALGSELWVWDGVASKRVATFDQRIVKALRHSDNKYYVEIANGSVWAQPDVGPKVQTIPVGVRTLAMGGHGMAIGSTTQMVTSHYLMTGEAVTRDFTQINHAVPILDGRGLVVRARDWVMLFLDPVPFKFPDAMAWLGQATNARIPDGTNALVWQ